MGRLPRGLDPDDYIRRYGGEAFSSKILEQSLLLVDYQLESLMQQYDRDNSEGRLLLFDKVIEVLADIENAMEQEDYVQKAANLLKLPAQSIRRELKQKSPGGLRAELHSSKNCRVAERRKRLPCRYWLSGCVSRK